MSASPALHSSASLVVLQVSLVLALAPSSVPAVWVLPGQGAECVVPQLCPLGFALEETALASCLGHWAAVGCTVA